MKVYVVEHYIDDYPDNGGGCQGVECVFATEEQAKEFCTPIDLFGELMIEEGDHYYIYHEMASYKYQN